METVSIVYSDQGDQMVHQHDRSTRNTMQCGEERGVCRSTATEE